MDKSRRHIAGPFEDEQIVGIITVTDLIAYEEKLVEKLAGMFLKEKQDAGADNGDIEVS